jgi:hypothetical protein
MKNLTNSVSKTAICLLLAGGLFALEPSANVSFNDPSHFSTYCGWFVEGDKLLLSKETKSFFLCVFWNTAARSLTVFDLPKPNKRHAWRKRISENCNFRVQKDGKNLPIRLLRGIQKKPLMSEFETRTDTESRVEGFPIGATFVVPKSIEELWISFDDEVINEFPLQLGQ